MSQGNWLGQWPGEWFGDGAEATYPRPVAQSLVGSFSILADGLSPVAQSLDGSYSIQSVVLADLPCAYSVDGEFEQEFSGGPDGVPDELRKYAKRVREAWETARAPRVEQKQGGEPETRDLHAVEAARSIRAPATQQPSIDTAQVEADLVRAKQDVARLVDQAQAAIALDDEELALILALMD